MIIHAHVTYENEFEMEVPDNWFDLDDAERFHAIVDEDECLGGDWDAWSEPIEEK